MRTNSLRTVLVTGAAGQIGRYFAQHSHERYRLRLLDRSRCILEHAHLQQFGEIVASDVSDFDGIRNACEGIDTVLHLAGDASPSGTWASLLPNNIVGCYNVFVAAKAAGCRRVIYASSIHAVSGYPDDVQVKPSEPVNPGDLYGVTKCFGEALARYMAEKEGLSSIVIRIGAVQPDEVAQGEHGVSMMDAWISERDLQQLIERAVEATDIGFCVAHGISNNRFKRLDLTDTSRILGYAPLDDLTRLNDDLQELKLRSKISHHNVDDSRQESGIRNEL